jgi:PPOX class probable F420-dependent enzyme
MSERDRLRMNDDEVRALFDACHRMYVATNNPDGTTHLVPMAYMWFDDRLAFWTDPASQKVKNLRRDPRITCLVETGNAVEEFRAVQIIGRAEVIDDLATSTRAGEVLTGRYAGPLDDELRAYVASLAAVRAVVLVTPDRTVSWDHRKLAGARLEDLGR